MVDPPEDHVSETTCIIIIISIISISIEQYVHMCICIYMTGSEYSMFNLTEEMPPALGNCKYTKVINVKE